MYYLSIFSAFQLVIQFRGNQRGPALNQLLVPLQEMEKVIDIGQVKILYISKFHPQPWSFIVIIIIIKPNAAVYWFLFGKS
jgi:hypothetical protein